MDSTKGKQHSLKGYKSSISSHNRHHENNNYTMSSNHGIFRTSRIQRHSLKWRKDHYFRGNYRSKFQCRKNDHARKSNKTTEDVEEEERKKKLNDTAMKLLSKIKTWNEEKNCNEDEMQHIYNVNQIISENNCKHNEEKINLEDKPKRIAHSKKVRLLRNRTPKSFSQPSKAVTKYEVNKETVKDFQNRIQHKLIEEIMQMPKENLQNVLNDPKINPIMELKMSRLVRENKLLIAQKLRALAESKMQSFDCSTNPHLLVDIDKLIDPVIETDLSVLPYELIKQMESIFQVQFDYSHNTESVSDDSITISVDEENFEMKQKNSEQNIKAESNEDLSLYECSTDEDEEITSSKSVGSEQECNLVMLKKILNKIPRAEKVQHLTSKQLQQTAYEKVQLDTESKNKKRKFFKNSEPLMVNDIEILSSPLDSSLNTEQKTPLQEPQNISLLQSSGIASSSEKQISSTLIPNESSENKITLKEVSSTSCQTECSFEDASTQNVINSKATESLYGAPLPKKTTNETISSLLEEVSAIQNLTNKLNERRLMIFLQLARMHPSGSFISDDVTEKNFIETITNGNQYLVESLKQFFKRRRRENYKHSSRSNENRQISPEKCTKKSKLRNFRREEK